MAFAWEPTGNKFAFIHGESPRISVSFYNIKPQGKVEQISKFYILKYFSKFYILKYFSKFYILKYFSKFYILKYFLPQNQSDTVK